MKTVVDVHCHTFNADDLPVQGFSYRLKLHGVPIGRQLSRLLDRILDGYASTYASDLARLDALLLSAGQGVLESSPVEAQPRVSSAAVFEAEVDAAVRALDTSLDAELLREVGVAVLAADRATDPASAEDESIGDVLEAARRGVRWAKRFTRSRLELASELAATFPEVDLFTPLLVDLDTGLADSADTSIAQQVELYEKLSRASMLGILPGLNEARIHPFIGFDPLRQLVAGRTSPITTPLEVVQDAVLRYGFVGIKVYPQMGWRPSGNTARPGISERDAHELDEIVDELAQWCAQEQVPITAHCARSNYADPKYEEAEFGSPAQWKTVLEAHPGLRLNLGHFGGAHLAEPLDGWPWQIARLAAEHDGLFADVGNHRIDDDHLADSYFEMLAAMWLDPATAPMSDRILYGSDWFMESLHPEQEQFLASYRDRYIAAFGPQVAARFLGGNALRFLGFHDASDRNARRLLNRALRAYPWVGLGVIRGSTPFCS